MRKWMLGLAFFTSQAVLAQTEGKPSFEDYVQSLKVEAIQQGFTQTFVDDAFADVSFLQRSVKADKNQPEFKLTLDKYLSTRVPEWKVQQAVKLYKEHQSVLEDIGKKFGVQPRFIVALWGNESNFGKIQGNFPMISALTTMAYDGRREDLFKKQLFAALKILNEGHIEKEKFVGSWAGAMGQSQFMPTSFLSYAYDYDGDGKKDIWGNQADVFASIANYLSTVGWDASQTWGRQVKLPAGFDTSLTGLEKSKMRTLSEWQKLGVRRYDGADLPSRDLMASMIMPDDAKGRIYLVYDNFHTLMNWNRSTYFGSAVCYLSDKIKAGIDDDSVSAPGQ
ncbi:lytic murein transglycosylase [Aliiglaciecola sp. CAU 1673]|uniref:lytic murein transglycosylase n=1 Tax=Aliiglaciecola sp. CAU 1673 TaxID=3032595 RepID=UPI0023DA4A9F|nr:lytic murein transglycosylase [Aliiglaciecola sp. CAU 1673]MDF2179830.1 lytic murein transglycosylase [Aliiglaciecola sp. CAU 1673]